MDISRRRFFAARTPTVAPFRPPWSIEEALFVERCNRCDDCLRACPTGLLASGPGGFPLADFTAAHCSFCGDCVRVCATGALSGETTLAPWRFGIEVGEDCLAIRRVDCRACGEACEAGAIRFRLRIGGAALPEVDNGACTGCGACIAPCPVSAVRRIASASTVSTVSTVSMSAPAATLELS
jgi:ferredoxin-type protein NapF